MLEILDIQLSIVDLPLAESKIRSVSFEQFSVIERTEPFHQINKIMNTALLDKMLGMLRIMVRTSGPLVNLTYVTHPWRFHEVWLRDMRG